MNQVNKPFNRYDRVTPLSVGNGIGAGFPAAAELRGDRIVQRRDTDEGFCRQKALGDPRETQPMGELFTVAPEPEESERITSVWSVKKVRVPVAPGTLGTAVIV